MAANELQDALTALKPAKADYISLNYYSTAKRRDFYSVLIHGAGVVASENGATLAESIEKTTAEFVARTARRATEREYGAAEFGQYFQPVAA